MGRLLIEFYIGTFEKRSKLYWNIERDIAYLLEVVLLQKRTIFKMNYNKVVDIAFDIRALHLKCVACIKEKKLQ